MNPQFAAPSRQAAVAFAGQAASGKHHSTPQRRAILPSSVTSSAPQHQQQQQQPQPLVVREGVLPRQPSEGSSSWLLRPQQQQQQSSTPTSRPQHVRSKSIPIHPSGSDMKRSPSEQQLHEDEAMADYRDLLMFRRIAEGIRRQQHNNTHFHPRMVNDMCLASIIDTRNSTEDELVLRTSSDRANNDDVHEGGGDFGRWIPSKHPRHTHPRKHGHRDARTTSYLDPATCKWIIAPILHQRHPHHPSFSSASPTAAAAAAAAAAFSDAHASHSVEDEMLFPLEL